METESIYNKNLPKIILLCFFAPTFFPLLHAGQELLTFKLMNYKPSLYTYHSFSCDKPPAVLAVNSIIYILFYLVILIASYLISRSGFRKEKINKKLLGAFIFYPFAYRLILRATCLFEYNPFDFSKDKANMISKYVPLFGNQFNLMVTNIISTEIFYVIYILIALIIVFRFWNKILRIQFFTFGLISCFLGKVFWFFLMGPILLPDVLH